jgi:hypothetical protein
MNWLRRLFCRLFGWFCPIPATITDLTLEITMSTATLNWTIPTVRADGAPMDISEVSHVAISMSADGGANFGPESNVLSTDPQTFVVDSLVPGNYIFRAVVVDTDGRRSGDADQVGNVLAPPGVITDLSVIITD